MRGRTAGLGWPRHQVLTLHWWALVVVGRPGTGERAAAAGATPEGLAVDGDVPRSSALDRHLGSAPRDVAEGGGGSAHGGEAPGC